MLFSQLKMRRGADFDFDLERAVSLDGAAAGDGVPAGVRAGRLDSPHERRVVLALAAGITRTAIRDRLAALGIGAPERM